MPVPGAGPWKPCHTTIVTTGPHGFGGCWSKPSSALHPDSQTFPTLYWLCVSILSRLRVAIGDRRCSWIRGPLYQSLWLLVTSSRSTIMKPALPTKHYSFVWRTRVRCLVKVCPTLEWKAASRPWTRRPTIQRPEHLGFRAESLATAPIALL